MRKTAAWTAVAALVLSIGVATAAAEDRGDRDGTHGVRATTVTVKMRDDVFRPRTITIAKGTKVTWVNRGAVIHTATSTKGLWDSGNVDPGDSWSRVFKKVGTFRYVCLLHLDMKGKVVVT